MSESPRADIAKYANHLFHPPLDAMFEPARWSLPSRR